MTAPPLPRRTGSGRSARIVVLAAVALVIGVAAVLGSRIDQDTTLVDSPLVGQPVPDVTLPGLEEPGSVSLSGLRGQVVVVNFWASWCVPCRSEHPVPLSANDAYRDAGVTLDGITFQDQQNSAVAFLDELGRGEGYRYVTGPDSRAALEFGVYGVPETFSSTAAARSSPRSPANLTVGSWSRCSTPSSPAASPDRGPRAPCNPGRPRSRSGDWATWIRMPSSSTPLIQTASIWGRGGSPVVDALGTGKRC